jgi:DNA-binding MarR family transcriptional regulator
MIHASTIVHVTQITDAPASPGANRTGSHDELTDRIIADFRIAIGAMKCAMSERLVRLGISMPQLHIMHTLQRTGEMTMSRLADVLGVSFSNATGLVDRLEERGFIERTRVAEDRRIVLVHVTELGARTLRESDSLSDQLMRDVIARLDPADLPVIAHAVAEVRSALEATAAQPPHNLHESPIPGSRSR